MGNERSFYSEELVGKVSEYALEFLLKGRQEWDIPHTKAVVFYAEEIAIANGLDVQVIKTAAWLHDIGYYALFQGSDSASYENVMDKKAAYMVNGARLAKEFLNLPEVSEYYSDEQKERIIRLVGIHDKIEDLTTDEEIVLMEADTLGAIDVSRVTPTFDKEGAEKYLKGLFARRLPKFKTEIGKKYFSELIGPFHAHFGIENERKKK